MPDNVCSPADVEASLRGLAHDLRAPLTAILGYTEALEQGLDRTPERRAAYLSAIRQSAEALSALIDEIPAAAERLPFSVRCTPINLAAFLTDFLAAERIYFEEHRVTVRTFFDETLTVSLDEGALRRMLGNLLTNTVKYRARDASEISLTVSKEGNRAVLRYHDDGPGVPADFLPHLFEQGARAAKDVPGTGLGLHLVKQFTEAMGGTISAENQNGLLMTLSFPLA